MDTSTPPPNEKAEAEKKQAREEEEIHARSAISAHIVYHAISVEGEDELRRSSSALAFSGVAAGLSMGFSLVAQGLLQAYLPEAEWRPLVVKLGYAVGFLIVILGRQQLFTENTLTPILPLLRNKRWPVFWNVMRLWLVVFLANIAGTIAFAYLVAGTSAFDAEVKQAFLEIGRDPLKLGFTTVLVRGIFAGWLIALMVWLLPFAEAARVFVIIILTYLVGLGHLTHIIAGSVDTLYTVAAGETSWGDYLLRFMLPTLLGNIIGGVALVAVINHAQVVAGAEKDNSGTA